MLDPSKTYRFSLLRTDIYSININAENDIASSGSIDTNLVYNEISYLCSCPGTYATNTVSKRCTSKPFGTASLSLTPTIPASKCQKF